MSEIDQRVFISYAWGGESERIADELDADLQAAGITLIRDKRDLGFKGLIKDFMQEIGHGQAVVLIISDKYLKSPNCMFELVEISRNKDLYDRIFPIVLADADIYDPVKRIKYRKYWDDKFKELSDAIKSLDSSVNLQGMNEELSSYDEIRDNVSKLTFLLKDMNTLTSEMHEKGDFADLIAELKKRMGHGTSAVKPDPKPVPPKKATETPKPSAPEKTNDFGPYVDKIFKQLKRDDYEELKGERFGKLKFNKAFQRKTQYTFLVKLDQFDQFVTVEVNDLNEDSYISLEKEILAYGVELSEKSSSWFYTICLILTNSISDAVKDLVYEAKPPKLGLTDLHATMIVIYSLEENDIFYPKTLPDGHNSNFTEKLKSLKP